MGPDAATNTVLVTLKDYDPESAALIADRYGSDVSVSTASVTAAGSSRDSDSAPWYGGSKITNGGTARAGLPLRGTPTARR